MRFTLCVLATSLLAIGGFGVEAAAATAPVASPADSALRVAAVFGEHMVLQRDAAVPVWGWAKPGDKVTVSFAGQQKSDKAGADGRWQVTLKRLTAASQPQVMTVTSAASGTPLEIGDILVGEVWLCSGQSNMDFALHGALNGAQEVAAADHPRLRYFDVPRVVADTPAADVKAKWQVCSPKTAGGMYAAAYFFARDLQQKLDVPIGLLEAGWSGMPAEASTPREALEADRDLRPILNRFFTDKSAFAAAKKAYDAMLVKWLAERRPKDTGNEGEKSGWAEPGADLSAWGTAHLPMMFMHGEPALYQLGAFWFRRELTIPDDWAGHALTLELGPIGDFDTTYVNGKRIGATDADSPDTAKVPRAYAVPADLVRAGKCQIAVRVFTRYGEPGFAAKPEAMRLLRADAPTLPALQLAGAWRYRVERAVAPLCQPRAPVAPDSNWSPTKVYNGMIAPLVPFALRGAIWYQGEHNAEAAEQYRKLFPAMVKGWRRAWGQGDFPFLYVQIANWLYRQEYPGDSPWAEMRDVQRQCLGLIPNSAMAVAIDIGEARDIHPKNKQEVGRRLALAAQKIAYGMDIPYSGPLYLKHQVDVDRIGLRFACTFGGLKAADGKALKGFTIAGEDRRFAVAQAVIEGDRVWVSSPEVKAPVAVRYAWQYNPDCNLVNGASLPASPFRTDDWPFLLPLRDTEPVLTP